MRDLVVSLGVCYLCGGNGRATCGISREDPTAEPLTREQCHASCRLRGPCEALGVKLKSFVQELDSLRVGARTMRANWTHVMNTLHDWKTKPIDGRSVTANYSRRSVFLSASPAVKYLRVPTHASQYDRVDPTEFRSLKDEIKNLKAEKLAWETERATHPSNSTEQQEKVIVATFSFAVETHEEDCIDRRFGEDEQGAERCHH